MQMGGIRLQHECKGLIYFLFAQRFSSDTAFVGARYDVSVQTKRMEVHNIRLQEPSTHVTPEY